MSKTIWTTSVQDLSDRIEDLLASEDVDAISSVDEISQISNESHSSNNPILFSESSGTMTSGLLSTVECIKSLDFENCDVLEDFNQEIFDNLKLQTKKISAPGNESLEQALPESMFDTNTVPKFLDLSKTKLPSAFTNKLKVNEVENDWYKIRTEHSCAVCLGLVAAPCIISCGHTFCGECLVEHHSIRSKHSSDFIASCPECRCEYSPNQIILERCLDRLIVSLVSNIKSSSEAVQSEIEEWKYRRNKYLDRKQSENKSKYSKNSDNFDYGLIGFVIVIVLILTVAYSKQKK